MPESVTLLLPNETPDTEVTTDDGTWQVQPTTGEVVFTPSPALVGDPAPLTFAAERTDGTAVTGRLVIDYVATAAGPTPTPTPTPAPAAGADGSGDGRAAGLGTVALAAPLGRRQEASASPVPSSTGAENAGLWPL